MNLEELDTEALNKIQFRNLRWIDISNDRSRFFGKQSTFVIKREIFSGNRIDTLKNTLTSKNLFQLYPLGNSTVERITTFCRRLRVDLVF